MRKTEEPASATNPSAPTGGQTDYDYDYSFSFDIFLGQVYAASKSVGRRLTARSYLQPGSELCDEPDDLVVLNVVVSVLHQVSP